AIYRTAFSEFGGHKFSGEAELRPKEHAQELVTTGLHSRMRHPIYLAHLCNLAGWTLGSGLAVNFALLALGAVITFPLMIWMEEREMNRRFGQSFRHYRAIVPLLPFAGTKGERHEQTAAR
ncbi:MAG: methyltransferase family protein, partial [Candidatus Angelobacter sp.]